MVNSAYPPFLIFPDSFPHPLLFGLPFIFCEHTYCKLYLMRDFTQQALGLEGKHLPLSDSIYKLFSISLLNWAPPLNWGNDVPQLITEGIRSCDWWLPSDGLHQIFSVLQQRDDTVSTMAPAREIANYVTSQKNIIPMKS